MMMGKVGVGSAAVAEEAVFGWAVVKTKRQRENQALESLENKAFEVYLPQTLRVDTRYGLNRAYAVPFFPGYLFVKLSATTPKWWRLLQAQGVDRVLGVSPTPGKLPRCLREAVIERMRQREEEQYIKTPSPADRWVKGQKVSVGGVWDQFDLVFSEAIDEKRALVLACIFGRTDSRELFVPWDKLRPAS